jgi:hypothetical protein
VKGFDSKHFWSVIYDAHLVTQISVANGNKQIS